MDKKEYELKADELLKAVPPKYREGCRRLAWNNGHSSGYHEVWVHLQDIIEQIFN